MVTDLLFTLLVVIVIQSSCVAFEQPQNICLNKTIDAFEFWEGAPQLWNFWNSSLPGYDPNNV